MGERWTKGVRTEMESTSRVVRRLCDLTMYMSFHRHITIIILIFVFSKIIFLILLRSLLILVFYIKLKICIDVCNLYIEYNLGNVNQIFT